MRKRDGVSERAALLPFAAHLLCARFRSLVFAVVVGAASECLCVCVSVCVFSQRRRRILHLWQQGQQVGQL